MSVIFRPHKMADILPDGFVNLIENVGILFESLKTLKKFVTVIHELYSSFHHIFVDYVRDFCRSKNRGHFGSRLKKFKNKNMIVVQGLFVVSVTI